MRIAWFSPMPPSRSGIAAYSTEVLPLLRTRHEIDVFVDREPDADEGDLVNAHDFVWTHRRDRYDLTVFQLGNASCHDYMWAYLFRYPGLVVLHDAQLHQARALWLLKRLEPRRDDYFAEFRANHPDAPADAAYLVAAGLGEGLYHHWPMVKLVVEHARLVVVHNRTLRDHLAERYPTAAIDAMEMGVAEPQPRAARADILARHSIPSDAIVVAAVGGVTPEKRISSILRAMTAIKDRVPLHLMIVGDRAPHYDVESEAAHAPIADRVHVTGYVRDEDLGSYLAASDICACLRWPSNRETSASWLRCLAAARATIVTDLAQLVDVPTASAQGWAMRDGASGEPVAVSVDVMDEEAMLPLALETLAANAARRAQLGRAARAWWEAHHQLAPMADTYDRIMARAASLAWPSPKLPAHLVDDGTRGLRALADTMGMTGEVVELLAPEQARTRNEERRTKNEEQRA
jgi:glycosyltransferase involved in cell wall biosynthesis